MHVYIVFLLILQIAMGLAMGAMVAGVLLAFVYFVVIQERERASEPPRSRNTEELVDIRQYHNFHTRTYNVHFFTFV